MKRASWVLLLLAALACSSAPARPAELDGAAELDDADAGCPSVGPPQAIGHIADDRLAELSGLQASRRQSDILWAHGDNRAELFAVDARTLGVRGHYTLVARGERAPRGDLEDLAIGDGVLYLGDIGANHGGNTLTIYRVAEPTVPSASVEEDLAADVMEVDTATLDDAETLLFDPVDGHLYVVEKDKRPHVCDVGPFVVGAARQHLCATRLDDFEMPSGGAVSADGEWIALRSESQGALLHRALGTPFLAAFSGLRCPIVSIATPLDSDECNGEAISFSADGARLLTASERSSMGDRSCPGTSVHGYSIAR